VAFFDLIENNLLFGVDAVLQDALENTTTIRVTGERNDVIKNVFNDEVNLTDEEVGLRVISGSMSLFCLRAHDFNAFLNDMVAILVVDTSKHFVNELD
jgi:hypothetical protein